MSGWVAGHLLTSAATTPLVKPAHACQLLNVSVKMAAQVDGELSKLESN